MGTGTTRAGWETGDPGYHPRCRFFGGPEMNILAENKKETVLSAAMEKKERTARDHRVFALIC